MDANAVESVHPSLRKVTKQGVFPMKTPCLILYLRIAECTQNGTAHTCKIGLCQKSAYGQS